MNIQWYPGHMTKAKRAMQEDIKLIDAVIELVDARVPLSSRNPDIDELGKNKYRVILLNKSDLVDRGIGATIEDFLKSKNGKINKEWEVGLITLADNIEKLTQANAIIQRDGLMVKGLNDYMVKHPLLPVAKDLQASLTKLLQEFGCTPKSLAKVDLQASEMDDLKDLLG